MSRCSRLIVVAALTYIDMLMESHRTHFTAGIYDGKITYLFVIFIATIPYHLVAGRHIKSEKFQESFKKKFTKIIHTTRWNKVKQNAPQPTWHRWKLETEKWRMLESSWQRWWWWQNDGNFTDKSNNIVHSHKENKNDDGYVAKATSKNATNNNYTNDTNEKNGIAFARKQTTEQPDEPKTCIKAKWKTCIKRTQSFFVIKKILCFVVVVHCFHVFFICSVHLSPARSVFRCVSSCRSLLPALY